jgi:hypothetical protein
LFIDYDRAMAHEDLRFRIEVWDAGEAHIEHVVAVASDMMVAIAALDVAGQQYPKRTITLRKCAKVRQHPDSIPVHTMPDV